MLIEDGVLKILTDPGSFTVEAQSKVMGVDFVVITHEHQDHLHLESLKEILKNNPQAKVVTNSAVKNIVGKENIEAELVGDGQNFASNGFLIEGMGSKHAIIYEDYGQVENTGYFFNNQFFYPGDSFYLPKKHPEILALPTAGPWMKLSEAIDYGKQLKPKYAFPVHDGAINQFGSFVHHIMDTFLKPAGIAYQLPTLSEPMEF